MRKLLPLILLVPACGTIAPLAPWTTPEEADAIATQRVDELEVATEVATGVQIERTANALPPREGVDWESLLTLAITAAFGSAGALGYRALDHRRKRLEAQKGQATA